MSFKLFVLLFSISFKMFIKRQTVNAGERRLLKVHAYQKL